MVGGLFVRCVTCGGSPATFIIPLGFLAGWVAKNHKESTQVWLCARAVLVPWGPQHGYVA